MNKKLLSVVLSAACVLALAACGGGNSDSKVLADADHAAYCLAGPSQSKVGGVSLDWAYTEAGVMTASSRNDLKEVSQDLYDGLKDVSLSSLYIAKDVSISTAKADYTKLGYKADGGLICADGSLTLKTASINYDAGDDVYSVDEWMPSAEKHGESLTPSMYWVPGHSDVKDANGLDHNSDPIVLGGAGVYTIVLARYATVNEGGSFFGIGLIQQTADASGEQVKAVTPVTVSSLGLIGSFEGSGWSTEVALTKGASSYTGSLELVAGDQFKVRANNSWDYSWGYSAVSTVAEGVIVENGGNIAAVKSGTYSIEVVAPAEVSLIASDLTSFTITFVENKLQAVIDATAGADVEFDAYYLGKYGTLTSDVFVGVGRLAVDVYNFAGVTLPEGIEVGDKIHVVGKAAVYKGLIEVTPTTITLAPDAVIAPVCTASVNGSFNKYLLSRPATLVGTVTEAVAAFDGSANLTVKVSLSETLTVNVYIKKSAGLDYAALSTAFATAGAAVSLKGNIAIFDGASAVDYSTSTGYQLVNPSVVTA